MDGSGGLEYLAREAIEAGRVPKSRTERPWGSSGDGGDCAICSYPIVSQEIGFELRFPQSGHGDTPKHCQVHAHCLKAWDAVRGQAVAEHET